MIVEDFMNRGVLLLKRSHQALHHYKVTVLKILMVTVMMMEMMMLGMSMMKMSVVMMMLSEMVKMTKATSMLGTSVSAPVMKEHWIDCCIMSPRLAYHHQCGLNRNGQYDHHHCGHNGHHGYDDLDYHYDERESPMRKIACFPNESNSNMYQDVA